ncbi:zinc finger BED domain-containing protein RICESLEEPER 2-like [Pistacia vera]|uniref:zinc finger BED domain-containing protein RICESLEEPER 2-like n=1 Tax=Pistacia vera TaxID=55513 RepID=UPI001262B83C|nr:zinc finger BED domain-containing protein RICESLEEPER 2-like [Pistacia vera]
MSSSKDIEMPSIPGEATSNSKVSSMQSINDSIWQHFRRVDDETTTWRFNQVYSRFMLAQMIIVDEQPFSMVEEPSFRNFVDSLQPLWTHISRFTAASDCMKIFNCEKVLLKNKLFSLKSRIALTTNIWTSIQNHNYLCLIGHFIDDNWVLQKRILSFVTISSHKDKEIGKVVEKCILEWGIEKHVSTITVDNADANDVAILYLRDRLVDKNTLIMNCEYFHVRCIAHILNLIVRDGLSEVKDCISRIRNSVKYVRSSPTRAQAFEKCVKEERIAYKGVVCLDVATRWNSTYLMLDVAIKLKKAFQRLEDEDPNYSIDLSHETPSVEDWEKATVFAKFLRVFYEVTKRMSMSKHVTCNNYFQEIVRIVYYLNEWEKDSNSSLQGMSKKMREKFHKYYGSFDKVNVMVLIATVLDPRCKMKYVEWCYKKIYANDLQKVGMMSGILREVLQRFYEFYEKLVSSLEESQASSSFQPTGIDQSLAVDVGNDDDSGFDYDQEFLEEMRENIQDENKTELERYLEEKSKPIKSDLNVLDWWKLNTSHYKVLSHMAKDVFAIPMSTVTDESIFSTSGRVLNEFQSSLTPRVVEALICTQDWLNCVPTPTPFEDYLKDAEAYDSELNAFEE